jgi:hypothetical protein
VAYNVTDAAGNKAEEVTSTFTAVNTTSGISDPVNGGMVVFPNPANDIVHVSCNQPLHKIRIVSTMGTTVDVSHVYGTSDNAHLSISQLPRASYMIIAETADGELFRNILIKTK